MSVDELAQPCYAFFVLFSVHTQCFLRIDEIPRSLQIFSARKSSISLCLGTVEVRSSFGFIKTECLCPSRTKRHPWTRKYLSKSFRSISLPTMQEGRFGVTHDAFQHSFQRPNSDSAPQ